MRVAVIDSGVNPLHPHITSLAGGVSIGAEGSILDTLGHGTAVMAAIQEKAPDAEYFAVKLFHTELRASTDGLLEALEWTMANEMDVVNLSLGTKNARRAADFEAMVKRALENGMTIVAARAPGCYPGCLDGVIGVGVDWEMARDTYRFQDGTYYASGYPRPMPGLPVTHNLNGISFAVANMTGIIASGKFRPNTASAP
jgi:subtilisin family serine protease